MKYGMLAAVAVAAGSANAEPPIKTLLITGQNNHNWWYTSRVHEETLEATGRFDVTVTDTPETALADAAFVKGFQLFVLDYNAEARWPSQAETNFTEAVKAGAGVAAIHSANNAFPGWSDYEKMLGLLWRKGETGHGKFHEFKVEFVDKDHPITKGFADFSTPDELYHKMTNPQKAEYRLLARAMSSKESGGTGQFEPMALTIEFGKGHVFATPLGHVWVNSDESKASVLNPGFRTLLCRGAEWAATGKVTLGTEWKDTRPQNTLTAEEKTAGWALLFDGQTAIGWHGWKMKELAKGWSVKDGTLAFTPTEGAADIATDEEFRNFELSLEWRVAPGGNSGIMYRCTEDHTYPWETGREFQVLDDAKHADGKKPKTRAGCMYDVFPLTRDTARPAMEWNRARIVCNGTKIEHWLNGFKVVETDTASEEYAKAVAASKFPSMPDYGKRDGGRIALQNHGDPVWYRNIKIRKIR
ncbi:hypothetical protein PHYC_02242 [Phycisphaerales bacterium]|nr:hypothetical protein PHYC_02242 [Phycisphaerales bacterium]